MRKVIFLFIFLFLLVGLFSTDVSGNQSGTWNVENNPYILVGEVVVPTGESLDIEAGVEVIGSNEYRITALGIITAIADSSNPIICRAEEGEFWGGFRLENEEQLSSFSYCHIKDTNTSNNNGINSIESPVNIENCYFDNHVEAISVFAPGNPNPPEILIKNTLIENCQNSGISINENGNVSIINCEITQCALGGQYRGAIQIGIQNQDAVCHPLIIDSYIHNNEKQGIIVQDMFNLGEVQATIDNCIVEGNYTGIYFYNASGFIRESSVINNFEQDNAFSGAGVMLYGARADAIITDSEFYGNYTGFYIDQNASVNLGNLNNDNIDDDGRNYIGSNIDPNGNNNTLYCITDGDLFAENCNWPSPNYNEISATITDGEDGSGSSIVDFDPLMTEVTTTISGEISYFGDSLIDTIKISLYDPDQDEWGYTEITETGPFTIQVYQPGNYYVYARVETEFDYGEPSLWGAYPALNESNRVTCMTGDNIENINIELIDEQPHFKMWIDESFEIDGKTIFPLECQFFIYPVMTVLSLYQDEDGIKIYSLTTEGENDEIIVNILEENTFLIPSSFEEIWQSVDVYNDTINYVEPVLGRNSPFYTNREDFELEQNEKYELKYFKNDELYATRWHQTGIGMVLDKMITNGGVSKLMELESYEIFGGDGFFPLALGNNWTYTTINHVKYPTHLTADDYTFDNEDTETTFYWDPPFSDEETDLIWEGYKLYEGNTEIANFIFGDDSYLFNSLSTETDPYYLVALDAVGSESAPSNELFFSGNVENDNEISPALISSINSYPNPICSNVTRNSNMKFDIVNSEKSNVKLDVYNIKGQHITNLLNEERGKGKFEVCWNGKDKNSTQIASGVYFYKFMNNQKEIVKKFLVVK